MRQSDETDLTASRPNLLRAWWPAAVWVGLIAFESTDFFSAQNTGGMLYGLLTHLFGQINLYDFLIFHHYLRKTGHVVGYGMLGLLMLRGWRATLDHDHTWLVVCGLAAQSIAQSTPRPPVSAVSSSAASVSAGSMAASAPICRANSQLRSEE